MRRCVHLHKKYIMNSECILQSNLLDIIFDSRNKDYGAYILRKGYNARMRIALAGMIILSFLFSIIFSCRNVIYSPKKLKQFIPPPDKILLPFHPNGKEESKSVVRVISAKKINTNEMAPKIVDSININKLPATPEGTQQSVTSINDLPGNSSISSGKDSGGGKEIAGTVELPHTSKAEKPEVLDNPDIMPQYPGGIKALLDFLKNNIHSPEEIEDAEDVSVKIKFVVNYDGKLQGFNVIQSGGNAFDNEVIRVLKKMPLWIPGKSNGENVSVYFVVPVKFTKDF